MEESDHIKQSKTSNAEVICKNCSSHLKYDPNKESLTCPNCHTINLIPKAKLEEIEEQDYRSTLASVEESSGSIEIHAVDCTTCGAKTTLKEKEIAADCPYCGGSLIVDQQETLNAIKPQYILPFKIDSNRADQTFKSWINGLWWAPGKLKTLASKAESLQGIYYPYWTYDAATITNYTGQRGIRETKAHYRESSMGDDGSLVTNSHQETHIEWRPTSGQVNNWFDDILVVASDSLPSKYVKKLTPWDLKNVIKFEDKLLAGFRAETYFTDVESGFTTAKMEMERLIDETICHDIGGDDQRINSKSTEYHNVTYKYLLLPIWISAYRYNGKTYRFVINGRSGKVQGERPYSKKKIGLAILGGLLLIALLAMLFG